MACWVKPWGAALEENGNDGPAFAAAPWDRVSRAVKDCWCRPGGTLLEKTAPKGARLSLQGLEEALTSELDEAAKEKEVKKAGASLPDAMVSCQRGQGQDTIDARMAWFSSGV